MNNPGDFAGHFVPDNGGATQAFANIGGDLLIFRIPGNTDTEAYGINDTGEVAGSYFLDGLGPHGFFRDAAGNLTYPIDVPGSTFTYILGINGHGGMVGMESHGSGLRGFFLKMPSTFVAAS